MAGALVVVGEALGAGADLDLAALDAHHLGAVGDRLEAGPLVDLDRLVALDHLEQLEHRLVVLVLVGDQHLVGEAVAKQGLFGVELDLVEDLERALAHLGHVGEALVAAQDRKLVARRARVLDRVVEAPELAAQRLAPADLLGEPELLEVGDVPQVPDQGAQDRGVDAVELLVGERLDERQRACARLAETRGDLRLARLDLDRRDDAGTLTSAASRA